MKKLIVLLCMVFCLTAFTACGSKDTAGIEMDESIAENISNYALSLYQNSDSNQMNEILEQYEDGDFDTIATQMGLPMSGEVFREMLLALESNREVLGDFVSAGSVDMASGKDTVTATMEAEFSSHKGTLTLTFDEKSKLTSITLDPIYSKGEILEKAGLNTVLGMGTVFVVLIFISLIISCFNFIPKIQAKFAKKEVVAEVKADEVKAAAPAAAEEAAEEDDLELVAVITAAIAASQGTSSDGFVVRSIKKRNKNKWQNA